MFAVTEAASAIERFAQVPDDELARDIKAINDHRLRHMLSDLEVVADYVAEQQQRIHGVLGDDRIYRLIYQLENKHEGMGEHEQAAALAAAERLRRRLRNRLHSGDESAS